MKPSKKRAPTSNYSRLNFTSLHIKQPTKDRLNIAKALLAAQEGKVISHDDLLNHLLDQSKALVTEPLRELVSNHRA